MDRISPLPDEILSKILAYATLPTPAEELQPHCMVSTIKPGQALRKRLPKIALVCHRFERLAFESHFDENEQRVRLSIHTLPQERAYTFSGTLEENAFGLFTDNVKHLGFVFEAPSREVKDLYIRQATPILLKCEAITSVTCYVERRDVIREISEVADVLVTDFASIVSANSLRYRGEETKTESSSFFSS